MFSALSYSFYDHQIKEDYMGGTCSMHRLDETGT
jgi:hypothetical protein